MSTPKHRFIPTKTKDSKQVTDKRLLTAEEVKMRGVFKERLVELGYNLSNQDFNRAFTAFKELKIHLAKVDRPEVCPECNTCEYCVASPLYRGVCTKVEPNHTFTEGDRQEWFVKGLVPDWCPLRQGTGKKDDNSVREKIYQFVLDFSYKNITLDEVTDQLIALMPNEKEHQAEILKLSRHIATRSGQIAKLKRELEIALKSKEL